MNLYEYRAKLANPRAIAWDVVEMDMDTDAYEVHEHLTDRERADFAEQFLSAGRSVNTY